VRLRFPIVWGVLVGLAAPALAEQPKREVPDYDSRDGEPATAGDVLLWIPRVTFFPVHLLTEYVIRTPLRAVISWAEEEQIPAKVEDLITFGPNKEGALIPSLLFDFGLLPSAGFYLFWNDPSGHHLRFHAATWGPKWIAATAADRIDLDEDTSITLLFGGLRRQDLIYNGIGPRSDDALRSRYGSTVLDGGLSFTQWFFGSSNFDASLGAKFLHFHEGTCCTDPSLETRVGRGDLPTPPGFYDHYTVLYGRLGLALDSRSTTALLGSGVRLAGKFGPSIEATSDNPRTWLRYSGEVGGYLDLTGKQRIVSLTFAAAFVDPIGRTVVPFTEQVTLGGNDLMPAFLPGRLIDQSAVVATLGYAWPIWAFLDGSLHAAVGNVFGEHLEDFDPKLLRMSYGLGIKQADERDYPFEVLVAIGTRPFVDGGEIDSVRIVFGGTRGF